MRAARCLCAIVVMAVSLAAGPLWAQSSGAPAADATRPNLVAPTPLDEAAAAGSAILLLNQERLLSGSAYGQRIQREVEAAGSSLAAENRQIEAQLTEEELSLTARRANMSPEAFRPLAEDFDARVEAIRAAQEAKGRALQDQAEAAQVAFFDSAFPILIDILRQRGASVLMDSRAVLLAADNVDITEDAIARINAAIGEGGTEPLIVLGP